MSKGASTTNLSLKDKLTIWIAILAFIVSVISLWFSTLSPYKLVISPPVLTQFPQDSPAMVVDVSAHNSGSRLALISGLAIRLFDGPQPVSLNLSAQGFLDRYYVISKPRGKNTQKAHFTSIAVPPGKSVSVSIFAAPFMKREKYNLNDILRVDTIHFDLLINGTWHRDVFILPYSGYHEKFKTDPMYHIVVPDNGFAPVFFPNVNTSEISGSIFTNS